MRADAGCMTWLFPEPDLDPREVIEGKVKAQLIPAHGPQTTGVLYVTSHRLFFVPGRGTPKGRAEITRFARSRVASVEPEAGRVSVGLGGGGSRRMRITLDDGVGFTFGVRRLDAVLTDLRKVLLISPSYGARF